MAKIKLKGKFGKIVSVALAATLVFGVVALVSSIAGKETTSVKSYEFGRGDINDVGEHIESNASIYTKDLIECQGLRIEPEFESDSEYRIFWYNVDGKFFGSTEKFSKGTVFSSEIPNGVKYCRIVIYPSQLDSDGNYIKDFKIKFYEIYGIANEFNISVYKDQEITDMIERATVVQYTSGMNVSELVSSGNVFIQRASYNAIKDKTFDENFSATTDNKFDVLVLNVTNLKEIKVEVSEYDPVTNSHKVMIYPIDANFQNVSSNGGYKESLGDVEFVYQMIGETKYLVVNIPVVANVAIYEYSLK